MGSVGLSAGQDASLLHTALRAPDGWKPKFCCFRDYLAPEENKPGDSSLVYWLRLTTTVSTRQLTLCDHSCGCSPLDQSSGYCSDNTRHQHCKRQQLETGCMPSDSCGCCCLRDKMRETGNRGNKILWRYWPRKKKLFSVGADEKGLVHLVVPHINQESSCLMNINNTLVQRRITNITA